MPHRSSRKSSRVRNTRFLIGIDEVGRGSLAGPVFVAAVAVPTGFRRQVSGVKHLPLLRDSKQLTPTARERWFQYVKNAKIPYAVRHISPRQIDRMNISRAANLAAERAFHGLRRERHASGVVCQVRLDGGLFLGNGTQPLHTKTVVKGDERISAIALASIAAKVLRDRYMVRLATRYPQYGFAIHKGYGTKAHRTAIRKYGPSKVHRLTFLKNYFKMR